MGQSSGKQTRLLRRKGGSSKAKRLPTILASPPKLFNPVAHQLMPSKGGCHGMDFSKVWWNLKLVSETKEKSKSRKAVRDRNNLRLFAPEPNSANKLMQNPMPPRIISYNVGTTPTRPPFFGLSSAEKSTFASWGCRALF
ncbi:hypothetical protein CDAR_47281 [Caerostris darwini]|uniref:Uncharacterized protein n=1 Tax=Caerostris darwini TaxID=1538125 RepID=A0AAV4VH02_9ARAC|nr:hypothetical protein CDAR_47281 [Caerostris darwini]